jgi:hypothetical protein
VLKIFIVSGLTCQTVFTPVFIALSGGFPVSWAERRADCGRPLFLSVMVFKGYDLKRAVSRIPGVLNPLSERGISGDYRARHESHLSTFGKGWENLPELIARVIKQHHIDELRVGR